MFRATHVGGPMAGSENDASLSAPRTPQRLFYAPSPAPGPHVFPSGYLLVGYDQPPEVDWPDQVQYALDRDASDLMPHSLYGDDGMEQGTAVYRVVD